MIGILLLNFFQHWQLIMNCFQYLGLQVAADGGYEKDVIHRMNEEYRAWGALKSVVNNR